MLLRSVCIALGVCIAAQGLSGQAPVQVGEWKERDVKALTPAERMKIQAEVMRLMGPGPEHKDVLAPLVGNFELKSRIWPSPDAKQPMEATASGEAKLVLGGRFLELSSKGKMMGMDFESKTMLGFDRRWEHFTAVAFDSMGTYSVSASGKKDAKSGAIVMYGEDKDAKTQVTQKYQFVLEIESKDKFVWKVIFLDHSHGNEAPFTMVEMTATRKP